jgi:hypothetical protein
MVPQIRPLIEVLAETVLERDSCTSHTVLLQAQSVPECAPVSVFYIKRNDHAVIASEAQAVCHTMLLTTSLDCFAATVTHASGHQPA